MHNIRRKTTEEFIKEVKKLYGEFYDCNKVNYINSHTKVCLVHPEYGEFWITPTNFLNNKIKGKYRINPSNNKNKNFITFKQKADKLYDNLYDYDETTYINCKTKVKVICPIHGEFWVTPDKHLNCKQGCPYCKNEAIENKRKINEELKKQKKINKKNTFIEEFYKKVKGIYNNKYNYHDDYVNADTKIRITCPIHGDFWQTPNNHLKGYGCPHCLREIKRKKEEERFILNFKKVHGDRYDISKAIYINTSTKICVICPIHGEFWSTPNALLSGKGCPKCVGKYKTTEEFIKEAKAIHGEDTYIYTKTIYHKANEEVCIICPKHGEFWQTPNKHLQGRGCPFCKNSHLEEQTFNTLKDANVNFIKKYKPDFLNGKELDFYLPEYNIGIECQGEQHFPTSDVTKKRCYLFSLESMEQGVKRDIVKYNECKQNNVKLYYLINYRIPMTVLKDEYYCGIYNDEKTIYKDIKKLIDNIMN